MKRITSLLVVSSFILALLVATRHAPNAHAATCTVTTDANSGPGSLREKIADATCDTINFNDDYTINLTSGELAISQDLTIDGNGHTVTISGQNERRVFYINSGYNVTLNQLTIANGTADDGGGINNGGNLTVMDSTFTGNRATYDGGGINNQTGGTLTVTNGTFFGNSAEDWNGGGIANQTGGTLTVTNSTFSGNSASLNGGGIANGGTLEVINSTFSNNSAGTNGGGIASDGGLEVTDSTFSGNHADSYGGGIANGGVLEVTDSTFSDNTASMGGGGIASGGIASDGTLTVSNSSGNSTFVGDGDGIASDGTLTVSNSTFSGNSAPSGGGIANDGTLTVSNSTFSGNKAPSGGGIANQTGGTLNYANTIIANSSRGDCDSSDGTIGINTNNLVQDGSCSASFSGNPLLSVLGSYGGTTQTFALLPGSPAIDNGDNTTCEGLPGGNVDQRGVGRPVNGTCDIGAFESRGFAFNSPTGTPQSTTINTAFANPLTLNVTSAFGEPVNGGMVTFTPPGGGASAAITGSPATISAGGTASVTATANSTAGGPYNVTASASGVTTNVNFTLTNLDTYLVTYNGNGNTGGSPPASQTKIENMDLILATNTGSLVKTGYTLTGWNSLANGTGTHYALGGTYSTNESLVLYAHWVALPNHTVTFNANGGSGSMSPQTTNVPTALALNTFTRTGYNFANWNTAANGSGTSYADGATYNFSTDIMLYAQWTEIDYTVFLPFVIR